VNRTIPSLIEWSMMPISAVSFDMDGTLAEVHRRQLGMWPGLLRYPRALTALKGGFDAWRGRRCLDLDAAVLDDLHRQRGISRKRLEGALSAEMDGRWPALFQNAPLLPAAAALLKALSDRQVPVALVSDYPGLTKLEGLGIAMPIVISCRALGALKPLPDALHAAASQLGVPTSQLLHVGDRWDTDGRAAAAAGCHFRHIDNIDPDNPMEGLLLSADRKVPSGLRPDTV
jgi:FMN phosphatase YigB (HAD superfamily)